MAIVRTWAGVIRIHGKCRLLSFSRLPKASAGNPALALGKRLNLSMTCGSWYDFNHDIQSSRIPLAILWREASRGAAQANSQGRKTLERGAVNIFKPREGRQYPCPIAATFVPSTVAMGRCF